MDKHTECELLSYKAFFFLKQLNAVLKLYKLFIYSFCVNPTPMHSIQIFYRNGIEVESLNKPE